MNVIGFISMGVGIGGIALVIHHSNRRSNQIMREIFDLEGRAHTCKPEEVEAVLLDVIGYSPGHMSIGQQARLLSITHFLMGRKREYDRAKDAKATPATPPK